MPLSAESRLILLRVKIERAKKHLRELEGEAIARRNDRSTIAITDKDISKSTPRDLYTLPELPFNLLPSAGDVVHNLRSALDHLAYQLAIVGSGGKVPSRRVEFPIAKDEATYESDKTRKVEGISPEAVRLIDALRPYKGGTEALWKIHELDNIDKHRALFTIDNDYLFVADWIPGRTYFMRKADNPQFTGFLDSGVEKDIQLDIREAFANPENLQGKPLLPTLHQLVDFVETLVARFLPYLE